MAKKTKPKELFDAKEDLESDMEAKGFTKARNGFVKNVSYMFQDTVDVTVRFVSKKDGFLYDFKFSKDVPDEERQRIQEELSKQINLG